MGASFQAPHATPRQRQMEMSSWVDPGGLFGAHYNTMEKEKKNKDNNNNNDDFGSKSNKIRFRS